jgi:hypothetical protein
LGADPFPEKMYAWDWIIGPGRRLICSVADPGLFAWMIGILAQMDEESKGSYEGAID